MPLGHLRKNPRPQDDAALVDAEPAAKRPRSARQRPRLQSAAIPPVPITLNTSAALASSPSDPLRSTSRSPSPALAPVDNCYDIAAHCDDGSEESDGSVGSDCGESTPDHQSETSDDVEPEQEDASAGEEEFVDGDALVGDDEPVEGDESAEDDDFVEDAASVEDAVSDEDDLPVEDDESVADASSDDEQVEDDESVEEDDACAMDDAPMEESDSVRGDESAEDYESADDGDLVRAGVPVHHVGPHCHVDPDGDESDDDASVEDPDVVEAGVSVQDAEVEEDDASVEEVDEENNEVVAVKLLATAEPDRHVESDHVEFDGPAFRTHDSDDHDGTSDDDDDTADSDDSAGSADVGGHEDCDGSDEEDASDSDDEDDHSVSLTAMHVPFNQPGQPTVGTSGTARVQTTQLHLRRDPIASSAAKPAPKSASVTKSTGAVAKPVAVPRDPKSQHPASLNAARTSFAKDQTRLHQKLEVLVGPISMSQSDAGTDSESGSATDSDSDSSSASDSVMTPLAHLAVALPGNPLLNSTAADVIARPPAAAKVVTQPPAAAGTAVANATAVSGSTSSRTQARVTEPTGVSAPPRKSAPMAAPIAMPTSRVSTSAGRGLGALPRGSTSVGKPIAVPTSSAPLVTTLGPLGRGHGSSAPPEAIKEDLIALFESTADLDESANTAVWDPPANLTVSLLPHQESGVQWMLGRENSPSKGGLLADEMGLGKTIQALALILATRDAFDEHQTTLVVAPTALCQQWRAELIDKSGGALKVLVHHGPSRPTQGSVLAEYDVVLTTYGTAMCEIPAHVRAEIKGERGVDPDAAASDEESLPVDRNVGGALFQVEFYRIILDEAHAIKTRENLRAMACRHLRTQYRWCLTGTPLANSVDELYSLLEFLRCTVYPTRDDFRHAITDVLAWNPDRGMQRLRVLLSMYVLRRTKRLLGNLPRRTIIHEVLDLSPAEHAFYSTVRYRVHAEARAAGGKTRGYAYFYALLMRLRQATNHPHMVDASFRFPTTQEEEEARAKSNAEVVEVNCAQVTAEAANLSRSMQASGALNQAVATENDVEDPEEVEHAEAGELLISATALEKVVRTFVGEVPRVFPEEEAGRRSWESTKIARAVHILQSPHREDPEIVAPKTIVFSQFISTLNLMESALKDVGIGYERFDGSMSVARKERALTRFKSDANVSVLLMSLMCGSLGLNLTVASRIILLDLWWNPQIESQAFDRVHRFGQEHAVVVHKLTTQGTVEDRIVKMQDRKRQVASDVLAGVQQADPGEDDAVDVEALAAEGEGEMLGAMPQRRRRGPKRGGVRMSLDEVLALFQ
ncbi:hypothetical protein GGF32_005289 [Allomyces javanicus]|nr:hypothetical protein GGF32_005289 [Allomyces javanicus]